MIQKVKGIVIRKVKYSEYDEILTVLTDGLGKISVRTMGTKSLKSKVNGVSFLCYSEFVLSGGPDMYRITQCTPVKNFFGAGENIERLSLATYLGQLAAEMITGGENNLESLSLLLNALYVICETDKNLKMIKAAFELRLMALQGFMPSVITCSGCGEKNFPMYFDIKDGSIYCSCCRKNGYEISENLLSALQYIIYSDSKKIFSFTVTDNIANTLYELAENYVIYHLGKTPKSLDYLRMFM